MLDKTRSHAIAKMTARCAQYYECPEKVCKHKISRRLRKNLHITILSLFGGEIIFEVFQPMWSRYLNVTDVQTDGHRPNKSIFVEIFTVHEIRNSTLFLVGLCDFLLVHNSNLGRFGPILHRFGHFGRFLCSSPDPIPIPLQFWGVPVAPDRPCWGHQAHGPEAIRPSNYFRSIPTYVITVSDRHRRTDRQTTLWSHNRNRALHSIAR